MNIQLHATHQGTIKVNQISVKVAILDNGDRIIFKSSIYKLFEKTRRGRIRKELQRKNKLLFVDTATLKEYFTYEIDKKLHTINFKDINGKDSEGYLAEVAPIIADIYIKAGKKLKLKPPQQALAKTSEKIALDIGKKDIKFIITKELNYLFEKEREMLIKVLSPLFDDKLAQWFHIIPYSFYYELFKLNGWEFIPSEIKDRPSTIKKWVETLLFNELPIEVIEQLKKSKPKIPPKKTITTLIPLITEDIGSPHLKGQINQILTLFQMSNTMKEMWESFEKIKNKKGETAKAPFHFKKNGFTAEPIEEFYLSDFNKKLKLALSYNLKSA